MVLCISEAGILRDAIETTLRKKGHPTEVAPPSDDDLFGVALGKKAIVYIAAPRILDGWLAPRADLERLRAAIGAAQAPGIELIVAVFPAGQGYAAEEAALKVEGTPYIILHAPPLSEEIAQEVERDDERTLWVPQGSAVRTCTANELAEAVCAALSDEAQGRTHEVASRPVDWAALVRTAGQSSRRSLRVHSVPPTLFRLARPVARWMKGKEPVALSLYDRLARQGIVETPPSVLLTEARGTRETHTRAP
jgi:hypothetical protein